MKTVLFGAALALLASPVASAEVTTSSIATSSAAPTLFSTTPIETSFEEPSPWRTGFLLLSTARYQYDNGDRTQLTAINPNTGVLELDTRYDPTGENFYDLVTTIGGEVGYGPMQVAMRFDTALFFNEPVAHPDAVPRIAENLEQRYNNVYNLDYISASYSDRNVDLTLGDFYITLGRGLLLAIRKVGDVGVDNKLRGANGKVRLGDLSLNAFGGFVNLRNFEQGQGFNYDNGNDLIVGGRAEYGFGKYLKIGGHGVLMRNQDDRPRQAEIRGVGATVELPRPVKWAKLYAEAVFMERDIKDPGQPVDTTDTFAAYMSANVFAGPITVLFEGKHYDNLPLIVPDLVAQSDSPTINSRQIINLYIAQPTAERPQLILLTNQTVTGGRVRVDYRVTDKIVPFIAAGRYHDETAVRVAGDGSAATDATAVYGGGTFRWEGGTATGNAGYRGQFGGLERVDIHLFADAEQHLWGDNAAELYVNVLKARQDNEDWYEGRVAASFKAGRTWGATLAYEFYTRTPGLFREHYFSVAGNWQFSERGLVRALVGGERAGLKCTGGVCRFFPGFEGGRIELDLRY
ncbi:MAG: DUF6029 family protein [Deltaproteobacteria bacterium]|jgi:hypothetical protein